MELSQTCQEGPAAPGEILPCSNAPKRCRKVGSLEIMGNVSSDYHPGNMLLFLWGLQEVAILIDESLWYVLGRCNQSTNNMIDPQFLCLYFDIIYNYPKHGSYINDTPWLLCLNMGCITPICGFFLIGKMMSFTENTGQPRVRCVDGTSGHQIARVTRGLKINCLAIHFVWG